MIKRGEIYFVKRRNDLCFGAEMAKSRPGIVVSNNALNATSEVVEVVYLTTQPKKDLPTHVPVFATGTPSTALCEQIDHVSIQLLDNKCGVCNDDEMRAVDRALKCSLDLIDHVIDETCERKHVEHDPVNHPSHYTSGKIETIDFIEDKGLGFHLGNAVKYITRAGKKDPAKTTEDLNKAMWYLKREIERLSGEVVV